MSRPGGRAASGLGGRAGGAAPAGELGKPVPGRGRGTAQASSACSSFVWGLGALSLGGYQVNLHLSGSLSFSIADSSKTCARARLNS